MKNPLFYAKILLFGEYGIIENSKGLTIPYNFYQGALKFEPSEIAEQSNAHLKNYAKFFLFLIYINIVKAKMQVFFKNPAKYTKKHIFLILVL